MVVNENASQQGHGHATLVSNGEHYLSMFNQDCYPRKALHGQVGFDLLMFVL